ncbi:MAG: hypothetical protein QOG68_1134 [Solirubrobacteraceae bacterium]|nr:hypothetical protein [Solirubrobacteraceae bacterium]
MPAATNLEIKRTASGRRLLMMDNYLVNVGPGRVQFRGHRTERYRMEAVQLVDRTGGRSPIRFNTGATLTWKYVDGRRGNFWKFRNAARFELWSMDAGGHRAHFVNASPKLDYCLRDLFRRRTFAGVPFGPYFGACSQRLAATTVTLGISVGWADGYPYDYPDNDIDVTGLRGCFVILQRADPLNHVLETNDNDNTSHLTVRLPYHAGRQGCPRYRGLAR